MKNILFVAGTGPGSIELVPAKVINVINMSEVICGYTKYIELIRPFIKDSHEIISTGMKQETERVKAAIKSAEQGKATTLVCGGDASLYALASLAYELAEHSIEIEIIPGITAAMAASAKLGAPISDDLAIISMSDQLTPFEVIKKRIDAVNLGDFVAAIYNPRSKTRTTQLDYALNEFRKARGNLALGMVKNAFRENEEVLVSYIDDFDTEKVDMSTIVIVGCKKTYIKNTKLITPRGYTEKYGK